VAGWPQGGTGPNGHRVAQGPGSSKDWRKSPAPLRKSTAKNTMESSSSSSMSRIDTMELEDEEKLQVGFRVQSSEFR
jgi:hypothetical protein